MSYIGYGEAAGVDYAHVTLPIPGSPHPGSSFFTAAGVSYVMQSNSVIDVVLGGPPTFVVPAHGSNSLHPLLRRRRRQRRQRRSTSSTMVKGLPIGHDARLRHASAARRRRRRAWPSGRSPNGAIASVTSIFVTGADGCYAGTLPPGDYGVAAARHGVPYEGGGQTPIVHPITVADGGSVEQDIALPRHRPRPRRRSPTRRRTGARPRRASSASIRAPRCVIPGADEHRPVLRSEGSAAASASPTSSYTDVERRTPSSTSSPATTSSSVSRGIEYSALHASTSPSPPDAPVDVGRADRARHRHAPASSPPTSTCTASPAPTRA